MAAPTTSSSVPTLVVVPSDTVADFLLTMPTLITNPAALWIVDHGVRRPMPTAAHRLDKRFGARHRLLSDIKTAAALFVNHEARVAVVGAGPPALAFLLASRRLARRSIYVESPDSPGNRRRIRSARLADQTVVEWEHQLVRHPFAVVLGETV